MRIIDLSRTLIHELPVDPPKQMPRITHIKHTDEASVTAMLASFPGTTKEDLLDGHGWAVDYVSLSTHSGTHMDAPYHYHPTMNNGDPAWTIDQIPLEWCIGDGVMVDFSDKPDEYVCTSKDFIEYFEKIRYRLKPNDIVLVHTCASEAWGSAEFRYRGCGMGKEATLWLAAQGIRLVGTDAWSWDPPLRSEARMFAETRDPNVIWGGHKAGANCIYCHMEKMANLEQLPPYGFRFIGFPIKIEEGSAGWVRAVAIINDKEE